MDKNNLYDLTNRLYRLTLLFPKKEPLRYKMREAADEILANLVNWESLNNPNPGKYAGGAEAKNREIIFAIEKDLEVLNSYFEVAKWQNWLNYFDVLEIQEEYVKIKGNLVKEFEKIEAEETGNFNQMQLPAAIPAVEPAPEQFEKNPQISAGKKEMETRKEKILKILKRVEKIQVGEINKLFPKVSRRTIRRDFQKLVKQGILERMGEKNNTFYKLR